MLFDMIEVHNVSVFYLDSNSWNLSNGVPQITMYAFEIGMHDPEMRELDDLNNMIELWEEAWNRNRQNWISRN